MADERNLRREDQQIVELKDGINCLFLPNLTTPYDGPIMLDSSPRPPKPMSREEATSVLQGFFNQITEQEGKIIGIVKVDVARDVDSESYYDEDGELAEEDHPKTKTVDMLLVYKEPQGMYPA